MTVSISTHVLDTERGAPAVGVEVELHLGDERVAVGRTDADGRIRELATGLAPDTYRLVFFPRRAFFQVVAFEIDLLDGHYHVPLLVSSYGCASYRGS